ncbi:hypothetical protein [Undibacterium pigrum]|uniref:ClpP protease-like protein n=1 Tax=Undibacterium pigrum TaxID=401470 RepID=A0A318J3V2_9BURK|nr:hypothetical protein [Undibacterium pigrum]PXX42438.1 hypothetical protein DFR42_10596 [Undibacterium pigrum]
MKYQGNFFNHDHFICRSILCFILSVFLAPSTYAEPRKINTTPEFAGATEKFLQANCVHPNPCGWISVDKHTLRFHGNVILKKSYAEFMSLYKKGITKRLVFNSLGGDAVDSYKIGKLIQDDDLEIEVDGYCLSACANIFFLSAKKRSINGILGFHGGIARFWLGKTSWDRFNPFYMLAYAWAKKRDEDYFSGKPKMLDFINKTDNQTFGWYIPTKSEIEELSGNAINGNFDFRLACC